MTRLTHVTGTDRIAEVAESLEADIYINVQGDEPLIDPSTIQACAKPLVEDREVQMSSVYCACREDEIDDPAVVKVVTDLNRFALYFSRFAIPFPRNQRRIPLKRHVGIYGYRRDVLQRFSSWPVSPLEATESLEQLRFLENGIRIKLEEGIASETAVDTPAQAELVARILLNRHAIG